MLLRFILGDIYNPGRRYGMPKCDMDPVLQDQLHRFMSENELTRCAAAARLGVERTTLWRFCETGRARGDTRARFREALEKCNMEARLSVAGDAVGAVDPVVPPVRAVSRGVLADRELKQIRKACEGVLALLDVYEAQALSRTT
jgi:hypothetical protein